MTAILVSIGAVWFGLNALLFVVLYFRPDEELDHRTTAFASASSGHHEAEQVSP